MKTQNKIAIYARSATREGTGIRKQITSLKDYCVKNDYRIGAQYIDRGLSGMTLKRPALQRLLCDVRNKRWDMVLTCDPDRISRYYKDEQSIDNELKHNGVKLLFVNSLANQPEEKFFREMYGIFAGYERAKRAERLRYGQMRKAQERNAAKATSKA